MEVGGKVKRSYKFHREILSLIISQSLDSVGLGVLFKKISSMDIFLSGSDI